jgi:hypothetical protein
MIRRRRVIGSGGLGARAPSLRRFLRRSLRRRVHSWMDLAALRSGPLGIQRWTSRCRQVHFGMDLCRIESSIQEWTSRHQELDLRAVVGVHRPAVLVLAHLDSELPAALRELAQHVADHLRAAQSCPLRELAHEVFAVRAAGLVVGEVGDLLRHQAFSRRAVGRQVVAQPATQLVAHARAPGLRRRSRRRAGGWRIAVARRGVRAGQGHAHLHKQIDLDICDPYVRVRRGPEGGGAAPNVVVVAVGFVLVVCPVSALVGLG